MKKQVVIFGASGGLGKQVTELFETKPEFEIYQPKSETLDIRDRESVEAFFTEKDIDIVINLAVYNFDCFVHKYTPEKTSAVEQQIDVNIKGSVNILAACLPKMRKKNFGRIIFASSIAADKPIFGTAVYGASKSFNESIIRTVCLENAAFGITANTIQLGYFDGGLLYTIDENLREQIKNSIPMKRWGTARELFETILFLINTPYVNGTALKIAGGL